MPVETLYTAKIDGLEVSPLEKITGFTVTRDRAEQL